MTSAQNHWDRPEGWYERNIWRTLAALVAVAAIVIMLIRYNEHTGP